MNLKYYTQVRKALRRVNFYISEFARYALPSALFRWYREFHHFSNSLDSEAIQKRVDYYCRFTPTPLNSENSITVGEFKYPFGKKRNMPPISLIFTILWFIFAKICASVMNLGI